MTTPTIHPALIHLTAGHATTGRTVGGHGTTVVLLVILATALVYGLAYRASLRYYPLRNCRACQGTGRRRAPIFRAYRTCGRCGGSGDQLRRYAEDHTTR